MNEANQPTNVVDIHHRARVTSELAEPVNGGEDLIGQADPMHELSAEERELARLRLMRVDDVIMEYLGTRDQLDDARHAFQKVEADLKSKIATMSMVLREKADVLGLDNFSVRGVATAYRNTKTSYRVGDWETFVTWVIKTGNTQCLEKRVAKLATAEVESALGETPPGVEKAQEVEFLVRRLKG